MISLIKTGNLPESLFPLNRKEEYDLGKKHLSEGFQQFKKKENSLNTTTSFLQGLQNSSLITNSNFDYNFKSPYNFGNNKSALLSKDKKNESQSQSQLSNYGSMSVFQKGWEIEEGLETLTTEEKEKFLSSVAHLRFDENSKEIQGELDSYIKKLAEISKKNKENLEKENKKEDNNEVDEYWIRSTNQSKETQLENENKSVNNDNDVFELPMGKTQVTDNQRNFNNKTLDSVHRNEFQDYVLKKTDYPNPEVRKKHEMMQFALSSFKDISSRYYYNNNCYKVEEKIMKMNKGFDCVGRVESSIQEKRITPINFTEKKKPYVYKPKESLIKIEENEVNKEREKWLQERKKSLEILKSFLSE